MECGYLISARRQQLFESHFRHLTELLVQCWGACLRDPILQARSVLDGIQKSLDVLLTEELDEGRTCIPKFCQLAKLEILGLRIFGCIQVLLELFFVAKDFLSQLDQRNVAITMC